MARKKAGPAGLTISRRTYPPPQRTPDSTTPPPHPTPHYTWPRGPNRPTSRSGGKCVDPAGPPDDASPLPKIATPAAVGIVNPSGFRSGARTSAVAAPRQTGIPTSRVAARIEFREISEQYGRTAKKQRKVRRGSRARRESNSCAPAVESRQMELKWAPT